MFTGIVTQIGTVFSCERTTDSMTVEIECHYGGLVLGESVAVDGTCLTVAQTTPNGFLAEASAETLQRTTLRRVAAGAHVNLERALTLNDRLGGHLVAGHVDGVGTVRARERVAEAERWSLEAPKEVLRFIAVKGSVAVDGVSLTVNGVGPTTFEVMVVPFTLSATTLSTKSVGSTVNLEADVLARYVARALETLER